MGRAVTHVSDVRDFAALLGRAAANPDVSDRSLRVYITALALAPEAGEVTGAMIAAHLPDLTESTASRLLGNLVTAGLLRKRLRTIGYKDGELRKRLGYYSIVGEL